MEARSDEELLRLHASGSAGAIDALIQRYAGELYGFLARFVGNAAAADDLVQDTFVQVHLAADSFDPARTFKPWLYTIAANKARDHLRARGRRGELSLDAYAGPESDESRSPAHQLAADDAALDEQFAGDERRAAVRRLIGRMPEHLRLILMLGYFQQLPYAEIAEILEIPVGTVKSRLHSAVNHFARLWQTHEKASGATSS